jgi:hypothetical protein
MINSDILEASVFGGNSMSVTWENYAWEDTVPVKPGAIEGVEKRWGVQFPEDYKVCVTENQGKSPEPANFRIGNKESSVVNELLHFEKDPDWSNIERTYQDLKGRLPDRVFPFASDPSGNMVCFDYRGSPTEPKIVFWDHEAEDKKSIVPLAESFTEFLHSLY